MLLQLKNVTGGYNDLEIVKNISISVMKGQFLGILGPNGSGKTTLLKIISGLLPASKGEIFLNERLLSSYSAKTRAREIAVLPQKTESAFSYRVKEIVALGRYPHQTSFFQTKRMEDEQIINEAMKQTKVFEFKDKFLHALSGGEQQRVMLAQALAQQPKLLLLDEPTNHLDISFQIGLLNSLKNWVKQKSLAVIAILHDLNIASLYCDQILLLEEGRQIALNKPSIVMEEVQLAKVYKTALKRNEHPIVPKPLITFLPTSDDGATRNIIDSFSISQTTEMMVIHSPVPFKTLSSAVLGAGFSWKRIFINRHVPKNYHYDDAQAEFNSFLTAKKINSAEVIGMMTAANLEKAVIVEKKESNFSLLVIVTAGLSNAVDVSRSYFSTETKSTIGTINTWVFIEGNLPEAAFVQALMTATEAKVKALHDEEVKDPVTQTIATGTSTDCTLISASQTGTHFDYAGTITPLGKTIGHAVYEATRTAIQRDKGEGNVIKH